MPDAGILSAPQTAAAVPMPQMRPRWVAPVVDELAIEAVRHARFLAPPSDASRIDRTFHIAYHFG